jgi:alpha-glucosidase (family GH31 glycosyl hydrolase)
MRFQIAVPQLFSCLCLLFPLNALDAAPLGNHATHSVLTNPAAIEITDEAGNHLRLRAYGDDMIRIQARTDSSFFPDDHYQMVEHHNHGGALVILSEDSSSLVIANGDIRLTIAKNPLRLSFADAGGNPLLADSTGIDLDPQLLSFNFTPDNAEKFIGYGQKRLALQDTFQLAGRTERRNYNEDGFPGRGSQGVVIVPFFMSSKGYGFFANSTYPNEGRFNDNGDFSFRLETAGDSAEADYFFIHGPDPADILNAYTRLTGRPRMLGKSYFGIHLSDNDPQIPGIPNVNQNWWETMTTNHHDAGLPLDHMVFDNDWRAASPLPGGTVGQWGGSQFAFEPTRYPDPATFRQYYDSKGLTLTLDLNLNNCNDSEGWDPSFNMDPSITTNHGNSEPDYWNPATREWFWNLMWNKAFNPALGYPGDAIWLDESDGVGRPNSHIVSNGRTWREMRNYYFFQTAYAAVAEGWDNVEGGATPGIGEAKRPHVWIRGATSGMQRYATHWTGDIDFTEAFYRGNLVGMQASGLSGFPFYNHDAGGFGTNNSNPDPDAQLQGPNDTYYIEWGMGVGSFSPIWRPHGYGNPRWPLNRNTASQDAFRLYGTMRYEMMPYIYGIAHEAHETGMPMARAMALVYPDEPDAWLPEQEFQYHWGESFLVVPPLNLDGVSESRNAWMPPATAWYDYWSDSTLTVPNTGGFHTFNTIPGKLPLFVKAGSIIPRRDFAVSTKFLSDEKITLDVYSGAPGSYVLVEDDGVTERFRTQNEKRTTAFTYTEPAGKPTFEVDASTGTYQGASPNRSTVLRLRGLNAKPEQVLIDGVSYAILPSPLPVGTGNAAAWDAAAKHVLVRMSERQVSSTASVVVTPGTPTVGGANLADESFDYTEPPGTSIEGLNGGSGWLESYPAPNNANVKLAAGLTYPGLTTAGKSLEFGADGNLTSGRDWADSSGPPADGTYWYSFLVKPATGGRGTFIPFKSTGSGDGQNGFGLRIDNNAGSPQFKAWNPAQAAGVNLDFTGGYGQTFFVLGKVTINSAGTSSNTIWVYQNPQPIPSTEPTSGGSTATAGWTGNADTLRSTLSGRAFSNNTSLIYDEVRIADSFSGLSGTISEDSTPTFTLTPDTAVAGQSLQLAWTNIPAGATINGSPVSEGAGSSLVPAPLEDTLYTLSWTTPPLGTLTQQFTAIPPAFTLGSDSGYEGDPLTLDWQLPIGCTAITLQPGNIDLISATDSATGSGSLVIDAPAGPGTEFVITYIYQETPSDLTQSFTTLPNFLNASATHAVEGKSPVSFTWKIPGTWNENPNSGDDAVFLRYGPPSSFTTGSPAPILINVSAKTATDGFSTSAEIIIPQAGQTEYRLYYKTGGVQHFVATSVIVGPQIFTFNVISATGSGTSFSPSILQNGVVAYADRTHVWSFVPPQVQGAQFIRMRQGDKENASLAVEVTASQDITLLLLIDNRVGDDNGSGIDTSPPLLGPDVMNWVHTAGFIDSGVDVGIDESPVAGFTEVNSSTSVYLKHLAAGQSFTFLEQNNGPTRSIYTIAAVAPQIWPFAFAASPATIDQGRSTTLQWNVPVGSAVTIDPPVGDLTNLTNPITGAGSISISPTATTSYTLSYDPPGAAPLAGFAPVEITVNITSTPFETWITDNYSTLTGDDRLPGSDPDGDGLNNLGEFAFGSDPTSGASDGRLAGKFATVNGSESFTITLPARNGTVFTNGAPATSAAIDGLIYQVQAGTGLDAWTTSAEEITGPDATAIQSALPAPPPGYTYHSFRLDVPPASPRAFARAHISGVGE